MTWNIVRLESCKSTMDEAKQAAAEGAPDRTAIIAKAMTGGRGRHGASWHAPDGGLYVSLVLRPVQEPRLMTLALANAVADVLEVAGAQPQVKWVNDVYVGGRKLAGILVEAQSTGAHLDYMVAGIGLNVNGHASRFPGELAETAATLEDVLGADSCMEDVEEFLLAEVARWLDTLAAGHTEDILAAWRVRDMLAGHLVEVDDGRGQARGTATGIDDQGHLLLDADGAIHAIDNGSVRLLEVRQMP